MFCVETSGLSFSHSLLRSPQKSERVGFSCLISVRTARIGRPPGFELVVSEPILHTPLIVSGRVGGRGEAQASWLWGLFFSFRVG